MVNRDSGVILLIQAQLNVMFTSLQPNFYIDILSTGYSRIY